MVDGIQSLAGCPYGKGNLIHKDHGKQVYTFTRKSDGKTIRIAGKADTMDKESPERMQLMEKVRGGKATPAERKRFNELHIQRAYELMDEPEENMFEVRIINTPVQRKDRSMKRVLCADCGESIQANRAKQVHGKALCAPCAEKHETA